MPLARTTISIEKATLDRFFRAYPAGARSQAIQRLIERDLADWQVRLARAAEEIETHPDFAAVREDAAQWEASTASDGFETP